MQAGDGELGDYDHQDDGGHAEKLLEIHANGAAHEADAEDYGQADSEHGAEYFEDAGGVQTEGGEEQNCLDAFAENHQKYEEENAPAGTGAGGALLQTSFNFGFDVLAVAVHPDDH